LAADAGSHVEAARLFGAAEAIRQRTGEVRFQIYQSGYEALVATLHLTHVYTKLGFTSRLQLGQEAARHI
jgi:hypothetical protein